MPSIHLNHPLLNMLINGEISGKRAHKALARSLSREVRRFVDEMIIPNEPRLAQDGDTLHRGCSRSWLKKPDVPDYGACFIPLSHGGKIASLEDYLVIAEQEGRSANSRRQSWAAIRRWMRICF